MRLAASLSLALAFAACATAPAPAARTEPPPGAVLDASPPTVTAAGGGRLTVYDVHHRAVAEGPASGTHPPALEPGLYTIVSSGGSSAFTVGEGSPPLVAQAKPDDELKPASEAVPKWLYFVFGMVFIGALATRRLAIRESSEKVDRRILALAGVAIVGFIVADLYQLHEEAEGSIGAFLTGGDGTLWIVRLVRSVLAAAVVLPAAIRVRPEHVARVCGLGAALGAWELLVRTLPSEVPDDVVRETFTATLEWGHLLAASIWIGGVVALAVVGLTMRRPDGFWPPVLRRFSAIATACVGAMILTGLWTAWIHLGPPRLLFTTLYGETLLVKLVLVLLLVGLGALNQFWLLPRVNAFRAAEGGTALSAALRHFRGVVAAEAVVGVLIALVVPFMSGSARNQDFQKHDGGLVQTAGGIELKPSGLRPGVVDYDVRAPGAKRVELAFSAAKLGVPENDVVATEVAPGRFRATGAYASMIGDWTVRVRAGSNTAAFTLPVAAEDPEPARAPQPEVRASTWGWGIAEVLVVLAALLAARRVSRLLTARRRRLEAV